MNSIGKRLGALGTAAVLTAALTAPALAAENTSGIAVQLDGQNVAFTDAAPGAKDNRTFLPFRAVFEAMGVQVSNEGNNITATRGDQTLRMTIGSTTATLTEGENTKTITMDVAPYVDSASWRTYVPVRFAAEAFGCNVGWDQDDQTVIIVDVDKLMGDTTFTKMDNYISYLYEVQAEKNQATDGTLSLDMTVNKDLIGAADDLKVNVDGTVTGVSSQTAAQMAMELDLSDLASLAAGDPAAMTAEQMKALKDALAKTELEVRMDLNTGMYYIYAPVLAQANGGSGWYSMDMNADLKLEDTLYPTLASIPLNDKDLGYQTLKTSADLYASMFGDASFTQKGDTYTATYTLNEGDAGSVTYTTVLTQKGDDIVSMQMDMNMSASAEGFAMATTAKVYADSTKSTIDMSMDITGMMSLTMKMDLGYKATDKAPETGLPSGVTATPLDSMLTVTP